MTHEYLCMSECEHVARQMRPRPKKKKLGFGRVPVSIYVIALHDMFADYI